MWAFIGMFVVDVLMIVVFLLVLGYCGLMISWCIMWSFIPSATFTFSEGCEFDWLYGIVEDPTPYS